MESPICIFWDIENCGVPKVATPASISRHVKAALAKVHVNGSISFSAVGDMSVVPHNVKKALQQTGILLHDVPGGGEKNATDFILLTQLFLWALEHPPPAVIMLISNDKDFSPALHGLKLKGYEILGASISGYSRDGINGAATHFWDWKTLALGDDQKPYINQNVFFPTFQAQRAPDRAPVQSRIISPPRVTLPAQDRNKSASLEDVRHWLETRFPSQETIGDGVNSENFRNFFMRDTRKELRRKTLGCKSLEEVMRHFPDLVRITNDCQRGCSLLLERGKVMEIRMLPACLLRWSRRLLTKKGNRLSLAKLTVVTNETEVSTWSDLLDTQITSSILIRKTTVSELRKHFNRCCED